MTRQRRAHGQPTPTTGALLSTTERACDGQYTQQNAWPAPSASDRAHDRYDKEFYHDRGFSVATDLFSSKKK